MDPRIALRDDTHLSPADLEAIERLDRGSRGPWTRRTRTATYRGVELRA